MANRTEGYRRIREEYSKKYLTAREKAEIRRETIHRLIPETEDIDREMAELGLDTMKSALGGESVEKKIAENRAKCEALQAKRADLLKSHGYPADYTDVVYDCPICSDSGYVDFKMCSCLRRALIEEGFRISGLSDPSEKQTFENFDLNFYNSSPENYEHMKNVFESLRDYTERFDPKISKSVALFGGTGLGKTHLSSAVARGVIEKGYDVYYVGAVNMISDFEAKRFNGGNGGEAERCFDCDLLIIDDLGTEVVNQFTVSVLYNIINTRLNSHKPTLLSTNLDSNDFRQKYWDRITSRVFGEFRLFTFVGTDVRQQKLFR